MGRVCCVAATALVVAACGREVTSSAPALETITTVVPAAFRVRDTVAVTTIVVNRTDVPQTINTNLCPGFRVTTPDGTVVGPRGRPCLAVFLGKAIPPGGSYTFSEKWIGDAEAVVEPPVQMLAPGKYLVHGLTADLMSGSHYTAASVQIVP